MPKNHNAPAGSKVVMTPNAFMTDETWRNIATDLCRGIRQMDGIRDHPDWWVVFSLDGFGSHLDAETLLVFHKQSAYRKTWDGNIQLQEISRSRDGSTSSSFLFLGNGMPYLFIFFHTIHFILCRYQVVVFTENEMRE